MMNRSLLSFRGSEMSRTDASLVLSDQQLAEVAFHGLLPHIKDKYASQEFKVLARLQPGCQERLDPMSLRSIFRRR